MNKCFAYKKVEGGQGFICAALKVNVCSGKACAFFKTDKQVAEEREKVDARLSKLPEEQRVRIKKKYGV